MPRQTKQQRIVELEAMLAAEAAGRVEAELIATHSNDEARDLRKRNTQLKRMLHRAEEHINLNRGYMQCLLDNGSAVVLRPGPDGSNDMAVDSFAYGIQEGFALTPENYRPGDTKVPEWWKA